MTDKNMLKECCLHAFLLMLRSPYPQVGRMGGTQPGSTWRKVFMGWVVRIMDAAVHLQMLRWGRVWHAKVSYLLRTGTIQQGNGIVRVSLLSVVLADKALTATPFFSPCHSD